MCKHQTLIAAISLILTGAAFADAKVSASGAVSTHTQAAVSTQTVTHAKDKATASVKATASKAKHVAADTTSKAKSDIATNASAGASAGGQVGNDNAKLAGSLRANLKHDTSTNSKTAAHKALATTNHVSHKTQAGTDAMLKGSTQGVASKKAYANASGKAKAEASINTAEAEKARMMSALHGGLSDIDARGVAVSNDASDNRQAGAKVSLNTEAKISANANMRSRIDNANAGGSFGSSANNNFNVGTHAAPIMNMTMGGSTTGAMHGGGGISLP